MDQESPLNRCPEFHELDLIEGNGKIVRVLETGAGKWDKIATRLYFKRSRIDQIWTDSQHTTSQACQSVFNEWLEGKEGLRTPVTWDTVIKALKETGLGQLADDLRAALLSAGAKLSTPFSLTMSNDDFMAFLKGEGLMESDCTKLSGNGIGVKVFTTLTEQNIDDPTLGFSFGGKLILKQVLAQVKAQGSSSTVPPKSGGQQAGSTTSASTAASATLGTGPDLTVKELIKVYGEVKDIRAKWYFFGLELGLNPNDLDSIKTLCRDNPDECLREALKKFLDQAEPKPTWKLIIEALESPGVGNGALAQQLRKKYK